MNINDRSNHLPYMDKRIQTPQIRALKAAIPYMEPSVGKMAALMVKVMEIRIIMDVFESDIAIQTSEADRSRLILDAIRPFCGEETLRMAEFMERASEMRRMAEMMGAMMNMDGAGGEQ